MKLNDLATECPTCNGDVPAFLPECKSCGQPIDWSREVSRSESRDDVDEREVLDRDRSERQKVIDWLRRRLPVTAGRTVGGAE